MKGGFICRADTTEISRKFSKKVLKWTPNKVKTRPKKDLFTLFQGAKKDLLPNQGYFLLIRPPLESKMNF